MGTWENEMMCLDMPGLSMRRLLGQSCQSSSDDTFMCFFISSINGRFKQRLSRKSTHQLVGIPVPVQLRPHNNKPGQ